MSRTPRQTRSLVVRVSAVELPARCERQRINQNHWGVV